MILVALSHIQICRLPHACENANIFATFIKKVSIIGTEEKNKEERRDWKIRGPLYNLWQDIMK